MIYVNAEAGCVSESEMSKVKELPRFNVETIMLRSVMAAVCLSFAPSP